MNLGASVRVSYWLNKLVVGSDIEVELSNAMLHPTSVSSVSIFSTGQDSGQLHRLNGLQLKSIHYTILILGPRYDSKFMHFYHPFKKHPQIEVLEIDRLAPQVVRFCGSIESVGELCRWYDLDDVIDFARGSHPRVIQFVA